MRLTGSEILVKTLIENGVDVVFGYPGGAVPPCFRVGTASSRPGGNLGISLGVLLS